jgi:CP family cyanate transporter-like MFS transporter
MSQSFDPRHTGLAPARLGFLLFGLLLVSFSLRGAITSVGPVLIDIQSRFGLSSALAGLLTTLPLFAFAAISPVSSTLARKIGMERAIFLCLVLLIIGIGIRYFSTVPALYIGMAFIGIGIAIGNVVVPGLVRRDFADRLTLVTALYTMAIVSCGGLGSGITVPLAESWGWPNALLVWALPAVLAALVWLPQLKNRTRPAANGGSLGGGNVWRSPLAWQVTLFMGFQSTGFYVYISWFPSIMAAYGVDAATSGWMLFVYQVVVFISTMVVPVFIHRTPDQRWIGFFCGLTLMASYAGLLLMPDWVMLWMAIGGVGGGGSLVLALTMFGLRASTSHQTVALSGMAQSIRYLMAAVVPVVLGFLHDVAHDWSLPLILMVASSGLHAIFGWLAGRDRKIDG